MTLSMIEIMARTYPDQEQEPPPMPATIQTMRRAYTDICQGEDPWTALGNFTNAWYDYAKGMRPSLVSQPLVSPDHDTEYTRQWAAFCAASVEFLCDCYQLPCPEWAHDPRYILSQPWSGSNIFPDITPQSIKTTPPLSPNAISSVAVACSKINTNCSNGCLRQDVKASPIREKSAATPARKKSAFTGSNFFGTVTHPYQTRLDHL